MKIESYLGSIAIFTGVSLFAGPLWAGEEISPRLANEVKYTASGNEVMPEVLNKIDRAREIIDAVWSTSLKGDEDNLYLADVYDLTAGRSEGVADVWPYTAAIEAHCSLMEALAAVKDKACDVYDEVYPLMENRLKLLIKNLDYYRGTLKLSSYATTGKTWHPYAVPRGRRPGEADVSGILNVYDDQMWLCRELIRAYRLTDNEEYLSIAVHLADYVLDGWDCWRDGNGDEYGGITWGPGYNSKHACSNAPIIQPLVWLASIFEDSSDFVEYYYRDAGNKVVHESRLRSEHYLDFAMKIYDWQKRNLAHQSGVYYDMLGADNTIKVSRGYRQHVDCGGATGSFFSYNTATMIAGAAALYSATQDENYLADLDLMVKGSFIKFTRYRRVHSTYEFVTDDSAMSGFNTWFNNVLIRAYADAVDYTSEKGASQGLEYCGKNLDYACENFLQDGMLPISLLDGWGADTKTKPFHQLAFASEYAVLASELLIRSEDSGADITLEELFSDDMVYSPAGIALGKINDVKNNLEKGIYICNGKKIIL